MDQEDKDKWKAELIAAIAEAQAKRDQARAWLAPHLASLRADPTAAVLALGAGYIAGRWGGVIWGLVGGVFG